MAEVLAIAAGLSAVGVIPTAEIAAATAAGVGISGELSAASALSSLGPIALAVGISAGLSLLNQPPTPTPLVNPMQQNAAGQLTVRQPLPPRWIIFGRARSAGVMFFYEATDTGLLYIGKVLACHPIDAIEQSWYFDYPVTLDGSGHPTIGTLPSGRSTWSILTTVETGLGDYTQVASPTLIAAFPTVWTAAHRLRGRAYAVGSFQDVTIDQMQANYPNGAPEYKATVRGAKVFDPRDGTQDVNDETTWQYSDNAALVLATFLIWQYGWRLPTSVINAANLFEQANICDELVPTDGLGGTEARYRTWGRYDLHEARKTVLNDLIVNCAARIALSSDGSIRIDVGKYVAPTVTLTEDMIVEVRALMDGPDPTDRVGALAPRIVLEAYNWQETSCPVVAVPLSVDDNAGGSTTQDIPLRFCPSVFQAQRLCKKLAGDQTGWRGTIVTTLAGLAAYDQRYVRVQFPEYGIDAPFEIMGISISLPTMTLDIDAREIDPTIYDWAGGPDVSPPADYVASTFPDTVAPAAPAISAVWNGGTMRVDVNVDAPGSANITRIVVTRHASATPTVEVPVFNQPALPYQLFAFADSPAGGETYTYTATALNRSNVQSTPATDSVVVP